MSITPTVGRKVYFYASGSQLEPMDATVVKVITEYDEAGEALPTSPESKVNLRVTDPDTGVTSFVTGVELGGEGTTYSHYRWMPYQVAQAAQTEPKVPAKL